MLKKMLLSAVIVFILAVGTTFFINQPSPPNSQAFINGTILTMNKSNQITEALLVQGERIKAVGSNQEIQQLITDKTTVYDLAGKTLMPGFIDAHGHFPGSSLAKLNVDLNSPPIGNTQNIGDLLQKLRLKADNTPKGKWILGVGYDDTQLEEHRHPSRRELDEFLPDHPVFLWHISGHMGVANSAALALAGIDESSIAPTGGLYAKDPDTGLLNGLLEENAAIDIQTMAMDFSIFDFFKMIMLATEDYAQVGVTTAQSGGVATNIVQGLFIAGKLGLIPLRLELWPLFDQMGSELLDQSVSASSFESDMIDIGAIKILADGSIQGYTGYLSQPYHHPFHGDQQYRGYPRTPKTELIQLIEKYHAAGYQIATHGNGDAAIDDILEALELAQTKYPRADSRHIIVHSQMARDDQLDKMKALGVTPSFFVAHTYYWGDRHRDIFMGPERAARMSPTASALSKNIPFTIHLDTPVVPMDPLFLVWTAVNRLSSSGEIIGAKERINTINALRSVTIDAAWQIFQEDNRGSIEVGKFADLVILEANPLQQPESIKDIRVIRTIVGGRTIFAD